MPPTTPKTRICTALENAKSFGSIENTRCAERPPAHAAQAEDGEAERGCGRTGCDRADHERDGKRRAQVATEQRRDVGADGHERSVPERELPRVEREPDREREERVDPDERDERRVRREKVADLFHQTRSAAR